MTRTFFVGAYWGVRDCVAPRLWGETDCVEYNGALFSAGSLAAAFIEPAIIKVVTSVSLKIFTFVSPTRPFKFRSEYVSAR